MRVKSAFLIWFGAALWRPRRCPIRRCSNAVVQNDTAAAEKLLAEGADPNEGRFAGIPPIFFVVMHQNTRLFHAMKAKGVDIKVKDKTGSNLLMWAASDDSGRGELVEELLRLGLDPSDTDSKGDNALTWALRRGSDTPAVRALRKAGASSAPMIVRAAEKAIALLQKSGPQFTKVSGCAYHRWDGKAYGWETGRWEKPPRARAKWVAPRYTRRHDGYVYTEGRWR